MPQGLCQQPQAVGHPPLPAGLLRPRQSGKPAPHLCSAQGPGSLDYGTEDEDRRLVKEFESMRSRLAPENNVKNAAHLNLLWSISERKRPERCDCCGGSGERECLWCHGTGAMTVGDTLYCSETGCNPCPVCSGRGTCKCEACRGAGKRASWMGPSQGCPSPY